MSGRRAAAWGNILALFAGGAFALALLEVGLRLAGFPGRSLHSVSAEEYERVPGLWSPGQDFVDRDNPALPYRIHINSLGLRGPETTFEPRRPRVLFIGDSFTFGDFVGDDETLPAQVQQLLGERAEVLNGGVSGTTIVDHRVFLERLLALRPSLVVLVFFENDLTDLFADPPQHLQFARNRALKGGTLRPLFWLVRDTATFNAFLKARLALCARSEAGEPGVGEGPAFYSDAWVAIRAARYAEEAAALRDRLARESISLLIAGFPHPFSVRESDPDLGTPMPDQIGAVYRVLETYAIPMVDLRQALKASGRSLRELYLFPHDGHASPLGYAVAAEALGPHVLHALEDLRASGPARGSAMVD